MSLAQLKADNENNMNVMIACTCMLWFFKFPVCILGEMRDYLAGIEMSIDLHDDLVVFIRCLFSGDHHLGCRQVLQLIDLKTSV